MTTSIMDSRFVGGTAESATIHCLTPEAPDDPLAMTRNWTHSDCQEILPAVLTEKSGSEPKVLEAA